MRKISLSILFAMLMLISGCLMVEGNISTFIDAQAPLQPSFFIVYQNASSVADRTVGKLVEKKLIEKGFNKAPSQDEANVYVLFRLNEAGTESRVSGSTYRGTGGFDTKVYYSHLLQITIIDAKKSKLPDKMEIIWQGELRSSSNKVDDMIRLAPTLVDQLFEYFGKQVSGEYFNAPVK